MHRWLCAVGWLIASGAVADPPRGIAFDRPEAWSLQYFASASLLTPMGPPPGPKLHLGLELDWLPSLGEMPDTVGYIGIKTQGYNRTPVFVRPRIAVGLPWNLSVTLGWVPPVPINGASADLVSLAVARSFKVGDFTLAPELFGQLGQARGDFTCAQAVIDDPSLNTFDCMERSHDLVRLNYAGLAFLAAYELRQARGLTPYLSAHLTYMNLGIDVNAHYGGMIDTNRLRTDGATFAATVGLAFRVASIVDLRAEAFYSPLWVKQVDGQDTVQGLFNVRALVSVKVW